MKDFTHESVNTVITHVIGFSALFDLWVIKIKKGPWSFAHIYVHAAHRDQANRARNTDQAARSYERFVYSIVKITR